MNNKISQPLTIFVILVAFVFLFSSCSAPTPIPTEEVDQEEQVITEDVEITGETKEPPTPTVELPTATEQVQPTDTPEPTVETATPTEELALEPLPPKPQTIEFQAEDGTLLKGKYYPAANNPSPIVVLMHWAPGDMDDMNEIAFWIQNRGLNGTSPNLGQQPWLDPTWFPEFPGGQSLGVFTFSFRDCDGGCVNFSSNRLLWLLDAKAAMQTAIELEGSDPSQLAAIGASIGADGAVDGCFMHNDEHENSCQGALSISPGDYLTLNYGEATGNLMEETPPKPVWCFWANGDAGAAKSCNDASGDVFLAIEWSGAAHGMDLIRPGVDPSPLNKIIEFLSLIFGL
jgi:hypothetical protein